MEKETFNCETRNNGRWYDRDKHFKFSTSFENFNKLLIVNLGSGIIMRNFGLTELLKVMLAFSKTTALFF